MWCIVRWCVLILYYIMWWDVVYCMIEWRSALHVLYALQALSHMSVCWPHISTLLPSTLHWTYCLSPWHHTLCRTIHYTIQNSVLKRERNEALKNTENYTSKLQDTERELNSLKAFSQRSLEDLQISRDELAGEWSLESTVQDLQFLHCTYCDLSRNSWVAYINTINCSFVSIIL